MPPTRNGRYWTVDVGVVERASLRPPRVPDAVPVVGTP
jgi:hypothetical protein